MSEIVQPTIVRLPRAIADRVPPIVSQMHHPNAELMEDADE